MVGLYSSSWLIHRGEAKKKHGLVPGWWRAQCWSHCSASWSPGRAHVELFWFVSIDYGQVVCVFQIFFHIFFQIFIIDELSMGTDRSSFRYCEYSLPSILVTKSFAAQQTVAQKQHRNWPMGLWEVPPPSPQSPKKPTNQDKINRNGSISGNQVKLGFTFLFRTLWTWFQSLNNLPQTMLEISFYCYKLVDV